MLPHPNNKQTHTHSLYLSPRTWLLNKESPTCCTFEFRQVFFVYLVVGVQMLGPMTLGLMRTFVVSVSINAILRCLLGVKPQAFLVVRLCRHLFVTTHFSFQFWRLIFFLLLSKDSPKSFHNEPRRSNLNDSPQFITSYDRCRPVHCSTKGKLVPLDTHLLILTRFFVHLNTVNVCYLKKKLLIWQC